MLIIKPAGQDRYALYEDAADAGGGHSCPENLRGATPKEIICGDMRGANARFSRSEAEQKASPYLRPDAKSPVFEAESPSPLGEKRSFSPSADAAYAGGVTVYPKGEIFSLGILIVPAMRRRGLALEALNQITRMYFDRGFKACVDQVEAANVASIRLHERAGFVQEEFTDRENHYVFVLKTVLTVSTTKGTV